jgi:SagB-type dehydrogenase family enzyme
MPILSYHQASKHHLRRYAPSPGHLDWATQPDAFRRFAAAPRTALPLAADRLDARFANLRAGRLLPAMPFDRDGIGALFELSLGLSAWKQYGASRWALRCNPSSGNLHPTESYLLAPDLPGIAAGVHHYLSLEHCLEQRAALDWPAALPGAAVLLGLTSIYWREAWKYGMRAFRYCQHDCGHAIAAIAYAAAALGWRARVVDDIGDAQIAALLGVDRAQDFVAGEEEAADCLIHVAADESDLGDIVPPLPHGWRGAAARLSSDHRDWPDIALAHHASLRPPAPAAPSWLPAPLPPVMAAAKDLAAARIFRQRRSAVDFDGVSEMDSADFFALLDATLPRAGVPPFEAWHAAPAVHLAIFVHRVRGLAPGLYLLLRDAGELAAMRTAMRGDWLWEKAGPAHLPLHLLLPHDLRDAARSIACNQDIAADSCFSLGMLARMDDVAREPWRYRHRLRECGMVGQVLYLEAEAAGLRGTGIGCFFDDEMHRLLGLKDSSWQSLYHFTVGGPVEDPRLTTLPPYSGPNTLDDADGGGP